MRTTYATLASALLAARSTDAVDLDVSSEASVRDAAQTIASGAMKYYNGNEPGQVPGLLDPNYFFWEAGLLFDTMINYATLTGDTQYNDIIAQALLFQRGAENNYMPQNQTISLGNDDQASWAFAAMTAAERGFPLPDNFDVEVPGYPPVKDWSQLAINVFNSQYRRWDNETCGGGLRWQIFTFNQGYTYKNSISNGDFLQLAARLARFTGNDTYLDWAETTLQWSYNVGLIDTEARVFDGTSVSTNCTRPNHTQFTANIGTYISGTAYASNYSNSHLWNSYNAAFLHSANQTFLQNGVMSELACEPNENCNTDQLAFKGILIRALANSRELAAPDSAIPLGDTGDNPDEIIQGWLESNAKAAAASCSGGPDGTTCGSTWLNKTEDVPPGLGQQLNALEAVLGVLPGFKYQRASMSAGGYASNGTASGMGGAGGRNSTGYSARPSSTAAPSVQANINAGESSSAPVFALLAVLGFTAAFFM